MITLYSTHCPKCKVIEKKLEQLNKEYNIIDDLDEINNFAEEHNIHSAPILVVDDQIYDFTQANKVLRGL